MHHITVDSKIEAALKQRLADEECLRQVREQTRLPPGHISNQNITRRNGGIRPLFVNDIGGCSANYR